MIHKPLLTDDPKQRQPDITIARERLAWEPTINLDPGLTATVGYFEKLLKLQ